MPSSYCPIFKVIGSLLFSHCMTIWGSIQLLLCPLHNGSATGGYILHDFTIGRITDSFVWSANYVSYNSSPNFPLPCILLSHWLQVQIFSMPNILRMSATRWRFSMIASLKIHTAWLSRMWTSTDLPCFSLCEWKSGLKSCKCELGISVRAEGFCLKLINRDPYKTQVEVVNKNAFTDQIF